MPAANQHEDVEKSLTTAGLVPATLDAKRQAELLKLTRSFQDVLPSAAYVRMTQGTQKLDRQHSNEVVATPIGEDQAPTVTATPKYSQVTLQAHKYRHDHSITTEGFQEAAQGGSLERDVFEAFSANFASDIEDLALNGDTSLAGTDKRSVLLATQDGWLKTAASKSHKVNAEGDQIGRGLLMEMHRTLPKQYQRDRSLRYIMSAGVYHDLTDIIGSRPTQVGDDALRGQLYAPNGIPIIQASLIPDDLGILTPSATPGEVVGTKRGPFVFTSSNNVLKLNINSAGLTTITFPVGTIMTSQVASLINDSIPDVAKDNGDGNLLIRSTTTGGSSTVVVDATSTALTVLGIAAATYTGVAATTTPANTVYDGSTVMLVSMRNLVWGLLDGVRVYSGFDPLYDRVNFHMITQVGIAMKNEDACVRLVNVRARSY